MSKVPKLLHWTFLLDILRFAFSDVDVDWIQAIRETPGAMMTRPILLNRLVEAYVKKGVAMRYYQAFMLSMLFGTIVRCKSTQTNVEDTPTQTPMTVKLSKPDSVHSPIRIQSGQMFVPPRCCPPLELRDPNGEVVQEFDSTSRQQRLVAPAGTYSLVGHDPGGKEWVAQLEVANE